MMQEEIAEKEGIDRSLVSKMSAEFMKISNLAKIHKLADDVKSTVSEICSEFPKLEKTNKTAALHESEFEPPSRNRVAGENGWRDAS